MKKLKQIRPVYFCISAGCNSGNRRPEYSTAAKNLHGNFKCRKKYGTADISAAEGINGYARKSAE